MSSSLSTVVRNLDKENKVHTMQKTNVKLMEAAATETKADGGKPRRRLAINEGNRNQPESKAKAKGKAKVKTVSKRKVGEDRGAQTEALKELDQVVLYMTAGEELKNDVQGEPEVLERFREAISQQPMGLQKRH
jgi:hypothetical protein